MTCTRVEFTLSTATQLTDTSHTTRSFPRQGLSYGSDGFIYETTGRRGKSKVRRINPVTYEVETEQSIPSSLLGEGSAYYTDSSGEGKIIHITWTSQRGFIYSATNIETLKEFTYTTTAPGNDGWGISYDNQKNEFVMSDGTSSLFFWDGDTLAEKRRVEVSRLNLRKRLVQ